MIFTPFANIQGKVPQVKYRLQTISGGTSFNVNVQLELTYDDGSGARSVIQNFNNVPNSGVYETSYINSPVLYTPNGNPFGDMYLFVRVCRVGGTGTVDNITMKVYEGRTYWTSANWIQLANSAIGTNLSLPNCSSSTRQYSTPSMAPGINTYDELYFVDVILTTV
jgi:hypothetical protein